MHLVVGTEFEQEGTEETEGGSNTGYYKNAIRFAGLFSVAYVASCSNQPTDRSKSEASRIHASEHRLSRARGPCYIYFFFTYAKYVP